MMRKAIMPVRYGGRYVGRYIGPNEWLRNACSAAAESGPEVLEQWAKVVMWSHVNRGSGAARLGESAASPSSSSRGAHIASTAMTHTPSAAVLLHRVGRLALHPGTVPRAPGDRGLHPGRDRGLHPADPGLGSDGPLPD